MYRPELLGVLGGFVLLAACARQPLHVHLDTAAVAEYEFLMQALLLDRPARESLWQRVQHERPRDGAALHRALLRSVPGHSGYDPVAADADLQSFVSKGPDSDLVRVARARLEDLRATQACRVEREALKGRLSKVVEIERRQDQNRR